MPRHAPAVLALLAATGFLVYVTVRAITLPFTFDESTTYVHFVPAPVRTILTTRPDAGKTWFVATNHLLNTLLTKVAARIGGGSEGVLRAPNVLAFVSYSIFLWLVLLRLAPAGMALAGFVTAIANPFLLDFFGLSRGYGLALGFLAPGIFLSLRALDGRAGGWIDAAGAAVCLSLAALAFYPLIAPLLLATAAVVATRLRMAGATPPRPTISAVAREAGPPAVFVATTGVIVATHLRALSTHRALYYGGTTGFFHDTVRTLVKDTLYSARYSAQVAPWLAGAIAIASAAAILLGTVAFARHDPKAAPFLFCLVILVGSVLLAVAAHVLLGTKYLVSRYGLFFAPLFVLALFGALGWLFRSGRAPVRLLAVILSSALAAVSLAHFANRANLDRVHTWAADMDTPKMFDDLERFRPPGQPVRLAIAGNLSSSARYYKLRRGLGWLTIESGQPWDTSADFAYLQARGRDTFERAGFRVVKVYAQTGNVLVRHP